MSKKKLVVNIDDVGIHSAVNAAVTDLVHHQAIGSISLISSGRAASEAIQNSLSMKKSVQTGCHLTLVEEKPVSGKEMVPSLIDSKSGHFYKSYRSFLMRLSIGKIKRSDVEYELSKQIEFLREKGLNIFHLDSHQHVHLHPFLIDVVIGLAKKYKIPEIRIPIDPWPVLGRYFGPKAVATGGLNLLSKRALKKVLNAGLTPRLAVGVVRSGQMNEKILGAYMRSLRKIEHDCELIMHPNVNNQDFNQCYAHWNFNGEQELQLLKSESMKKHLDLGGFQKSYARHD